MKTLSIKTLFILSVVSAFMLSCQKHSVPDSKKKSNAEQVDLMESDYQVVIKSNKSTKVSSEFTYNMTEDNMVFSAEVYRTVGGESVLVPSDSIIFHWGSTDLDILYPEEGNGDTMTYHFGTKAGEAGVTLEVDIEGVTSPSVTGKKIYANCDAAVQHAVKVNDNRFVEFKKGSDIIYSNKQNYSMMYIRANFTGYVILTFEKTLPGFQFMTLGSSEYKDFDSVDSVQVYVTKYDSLEAPDGIDGTPIFYRYTGSDFNISSNIYVSVDGQDNYQSILNIQVYDTRYGVVHDLNLLTDGYSSLYGEDVKYNYTGMRKYYVSAPTGNGTWKCKKTSVNSDHFVEEFGDDYVKITISDKNTGLDPIVASYTFTDANGKMFAVLNYCHMNEEGIYGITSDLPTIFTKYDEGISNEYSHSFVGCNKTFTLSCPTGNGTWKYTKESSDSKHFSESVTESTFKYIINEKNDTDESITARYVFTDKNGRIFAILQVEHKCK